MGVTAHYNEEIISYQAIWHQSNGIALHCRLTCVPAVTILGNGWWRSRYVAMAGRWAFVTTRRRILSYLALGKRQIHCHQMVGLTWHQR